ncbi:myosin light chain kinase 2, skeletal/cardiac muscle-like isoform X2 [Stegostoma tigrinum]|uniref:myosin light chain kinase 2, skeletal/cardiac muscle-like isoform X2 n=1 Tax=Stegostoma tigrinum TaxID=3053191 RepID=UPI0028703B43|nr:myosin light chain kinase 2, skeletal/cardiac muscle-like isoform X2 [Stegostoma tigrinum]
MDTSTEQETLKSSHKRCESLAEVTDQSHKSTGTTLGGSIKVSVQQGVLPPEADNSQFQELVDSQAPHGPGLHQEHSPEEPIDVSLDPAKDLPEKCSPKNPIDVSLDPAIDLPEKCSPENPIDVSLDPAIDLPEECSPENPIDVSLDPVIGLPEECRPETPIDVSLDSTIDLLEECSPENPIDVSLDSTIDLPEECSPETPINVSLDSTIDLPEECSLENPIDVSLDPARDLGEERHCELIVNSEHIFEEPTGLGHNEAGCDSRRGLAVDTALITSPEDPGSQHSNGCPPSVHSSHEEGVPESAASIADGVAVGTGLTSDGPDLCAEARRLGTVRSPTDSPPQRPDTSQHQAGGGEHGFLAEPGAGGSRPVLSADVPQTEGGASKDMKEGTESEGATVSTAPWCQEEQAAVQGSTGEDNAIKVIDDRPPQPAPFEHRCVSFRTGPVRSFYQYNLSEVLGGGRFGSVHRCTERSSGLQLAMKIIKVRSAKEKESITNEVQVMNLLNHVNLIQLYDAFETRSEMILMMEYVEGGELFERIVDENYSLTELDAMVYVKQICQGVHYMHNMYVLHLDLKPENILCVDHNGNQVKIIDFGLARRYKPRDKLRVSFGTPEFLAPEIVNFEHVSFPTDMWSLGVITYMLLSGLSPFLGDSDAETLSNILTTNCNFDDEAFENISEEAKDFIANLLIREKSGRISAAQCLKHPWLSNFAAKSKHSKIQLKSQLLLKKYVMKRLWKKNYYAIAAANRLKKISSCGSLASLAI